MTTAILDGDIIAYRAACIGEKDDDFGEPGEKIYSLSSATDAVDMIIRDWTVRARAQVPVVALSCDGKNFRYQVYPRYKHSRKGEKPYLYWPIIKHIEKNYTVLRKPLLEADDVIGIMASMNPSKYIGVSVDKDLKTIPGRMFNPDKDAIPRKITQQLADRYWMYQTLIGDSTDGYPGCPKIGPVKAEALLGTDTQIPVIWPRVVDAFNQKGLSEDDAIQMARVARILRNTDYDRETQEVILWHPRKPGRLGMTAGASNSKGTPTAGVDTTTTAPDPESPPVSPTPSRDASPAAKARRPRKRAKTNTRGV